MTWIVSEKQFSRDRIESNGNKFLLSNGYMGYRGTMEEFGRNQLVACVLSGIYDQVDDKWREPVNAPNGLITRVYHQGKPITALDIQPVEHEQSMDMRRGLHRRQTRFALDGSLAVAIEAERFCSLDNVHLIAMRYQIQSDTDGSFVIETGIDGDIWDINGPHLDQMQPGRQESVLHVTAVTHELRHPVAVAEGLAVDFGTQEVVASDRAVFRRITFDAKAGRSYSFTKCVVVFTGLDVTDPREAAVRGCLEAMRDGYERLLVRHENAWADRWRESDVVIEGDDEAQLALRYSIYLLVSACPSHSDRVSIPARALSAQVYKGAIFWDTEMFMLPMFLFTWPSLARNLVRYRCHSLDGARRKAAEYGYDGAFYAWESQEAGNDACTLFNINDVFTGRPIRTYFRDKQIHISADVVFGIWQYYTLTGDESILLDGGAEVLLEAARFYVSHAYYKPAKRRYELLDVLGPDEYHDRVNNNAFTNVMARYTLDAAIDVLALLESRHPDFRADLIARIDFQNDIASIERMRDQLYLPQPDPQTGVIEQFDGYHRLEDVSLADLRKRIINPNEYLGGHGPAATTQIIKQADVVMMLHVLGNQFSTEVKRANWRFYEPRTEHGSSLSACAHAIVAAEIGEIDWAYKYFLKTATIDLTGEGKQYVGDLYIGGTHPAANGGAWMTAIFGFAGLRADAEQISLHPRLPGQWKSLAFRLLWRGQRLSVAIDRKQITVRADKTNTAAVPFMIDDRMLECLPDREIRISYIDWPG